MVEDGVDRLLVAVDDLQDSVGQAGLLHQFREHQRHGRIALGGLEDEGVSGGDGRAELPHRDHGGEVERRDAGGHAERLAQGIHVDAGAGAVGELAFQQVRRADAELGDLEPADHVARRVGQRLAVLAAERLGEFVHVAVEEGNELHQDAGAALGVGRAPHRLGGLGALYGGVEFGGGGERHAGLDLAGGGVEDVGEAAGRARDMFAVDEMREVVHGVSFMRSARTIATDAGMCRLNFSRAVLRICRRRGA